MPVSSLEVNKRRVIIENVRPEIDNGLFAVKRVLGDSVEVEADIFADGHDELAARLRYRSVLEEGWHELAFTLLGNDHWRVSFTPEKLGEYTYQIVAWADAFLSWQRDLRKRFEAEQDISQELLVGAALVRQAANRATGEDSRRLEARADGLERDWETALKAEMALDPALTELMELYPDLNSATTYDHQQRILVDRERARFSAWYEMFPRSAAGTPDQHGTFEDVINRLPYIKEMGFDILYLPPIHPIGTVNRKGANNSPAGQPGEPGSPWAIGSAAGGHKSINPDLGTLADFQRLLAEARERDIEIALDIAFQCAPDHPWVVEHPQWFKHRPDGSIRYAENPPKRYEDIYPIDFDSEDWQALWRELESVIRYWIDQGVSVFRVDNPHTKPLAFWQWLLASIRSDHPEVIFLSESFTRPRTMYYLAKIGFHQSYTYFAWRNQKWDLSQYFTELTQTDVKEYFRPSLWPNTPDILNEFLQRSGRPGFVLRLLLAATLGASYGIYGPPFELLVGEPREEGSEEYRDSEKYQLRSWDINASYSLSELISVINRVRRTNPALQRDDSLRVQQTDSDQLFAFTKNRDGNLILVVANLDPYNLQTGWVRLPLADFGLDPNQPYTVHDLIDGARYGWQGEWNYVALNPYVLPVHVFRIEDATSLAAALPEGTASL